MRNARTTTTARFPLTRRGCRKAKGFFPTCARTRGPPVRGLSAEAVLSGGACLVGAPGGSGAGGESYKLIKTVEEDALKEFSFGSSRREGKSCVINLFYNFSVIC